MCSIVRSREDFLRRVEPQSLLKAGGKLSSLKVAFHGGLFFPRDDWVNLNKTIGDLSPYITGMEKLCFAALTAIR